MTMNITRKLRCLAAAFIIPKMRMSRLFFVAVLLFLMGNLALTFTSTMSNPDSARHKFGGTNRGSYADLHKYELKKNATEEQFRIIWIPAAVVPSVIIGTIIGIFLHKYWHNCRNKCCRNGYERAEVENVQSNFAEQCAIPGSGENIADVSININPPGEEIRPTKHSSKSKGKFTKDEDGPCEITKELARCSDHKLFRVTECYLEQLKSTTEDVLEHISESLINKCRMSEMNVEKIRTLFRDNRRSDASQCMLEAILAGDTVDCRMFWNELSKTQVDPQILLQLLTQDVEIESVPYKITQVLGQCIDLKLCRITEISQVQLKSAIEDIVEHISESLISTGRMSKMNAEKIRTLIRDNRRSDASQRILEEILAGDTEDCRIFWNVLSKTHVDPQFLLLLLTQDVKIESVPYKITQVLGQCIDLKLCRITEISQGQLKSAIEDIVEHISESLISTGRMSKMKAEKIRTLIRDNRRSDASQRILEELLAGDIGDCRMFWNVLSKTQVDPQFLLQLLTQDVQIDVIYRHRCNLRSQSSRLKLPKPCLISDIYIEPTIIDIRHKHANITRESYVLTGKVENLELFKPSNRDSGTSTINIVYGAAGTGKTTLIQKLIYDWATGMKYKDFSFVLHFKIQDLKAIKGRLTLSRLTLDTYPYLENYLEHLWNEPQRLLLIFDDLDQMYPPLTLSDTDRNSNPRSRYMDTESEYLVCDIISGLLQGEILKGCSVLITAQVWNLEPLHHVVADSNFQVMGFTSEKAKEYFRQNASGTLEIIEQNEILLDMCSNPLFCITLASLLEFSQAQEEGQTTITIISHTQVLSDYVAHLLAKCGYDRDTNRKYLTAIGELAEKGIRQNTLSFEGAALSDLDLINPMFISLFMCQDPEKQSGSVIYEFSHSVLRDFLAALTCVLSPPISRLKRVLNEISADIAGRFGLFSLFLIGLSSRKSTGGLERALQPFTTEVTSCISEWLTSSVSRRLKDMDMKHTQRMFLCTLYSLLEFGDNEIMKKVLDSITTIKLNHIRLKPPDCIVLSRTLNSLEVIQELDISSCFAQPEEIWKLEKVLLRCATLRMSQNNLQDSGVQRLLDVLKNSKVKTLALKSNHLTDHCLESVFFALTTNPTLMQLNLSNSSQDRNQANQFTDEKLQYHYERSIQQKEFKWRRIKNIGQDIAQIGIESNCLTLITD